MYKEPDNSSNEFVLAGMFICLVLVFASLIACASNQTYISGHEGRSGQKAEVDSRVGTVER